MSSNQFSLVKKAVEYLINSVKDYLSIEEEVDNNFPGAVCAAYQYWYDLNSDKIKYDGFWANYDDVSYLERMQVFHMQVEFVQDITNNKLHMDMGINAINESHTWDGNSWSKYVMTEEDREGLEMINEIIEQKPQRIEMPCYFCKKMNDKDVPLCWNCGSSNPTKEV